MTLKLNCANMRGSTTLEVYRACLYDDRRSLSEGDLIKIYGSEVVEFAMVAFVMKDSPGEGTDVFRGVSVLAVEMTEENHDRLQRDAACRPRGADCQCAGLFGGEFNRRRLADVRR